jgi:hypothetical protein
MIRQIDKSRFHTPMSGHPELQRELAWYATGDDAVLGVVILNVASETYAWAVLTEKVKGQGFAAIASGNGVTGGLPMGSVRGEKLFPVSYARSFSPSF